MKYRNPIIFADYSDPDVIRVGDTFYMTASSFNYTPGLPILVSKDLVNWELKNYALENIGQDRFKIPRHSEGVWAPAIRFHNGVFYIYYGMPDEGYYVVRTRDPLGKWDEPVCVLEGKGLIDPCPFWDEDGKAYIIHGYAKSRIGFKSILGIFEMNPDGTRAISEDHFIFDGNAPEHPAVTIEGPKVYKRNGYYYILAPAGGVKHGYQVALRSRDIRGPYEIKTVMEQGNTVINGPHQGGLVDTERGDEWFIHFQDRGLYGRICHLQPVTWKDDLPVIGAIPEGEDNTSNEGTCGYPVYEHEMPNCNVGVFVSHDKENNLQLPHQVIETFRNGRPGHSWQWLGDHDVSFVGTIPGSDGIRLFSLNPSGDAEPILWRSANVFTQKLVYPVFKTQITIDASGLKDSERAGVCMMGGQYVTAYIRREADEYYICVAESEGGDRDKKEIIKKSWSLDELCQRYNVKVDDYVKEFGFNMIFTYKDRKFDSKDLYFRNVDEPLFGENPSLYMALDFANGQEPFDLGVKFMPSDHTWVGAKLGIYALCDNDGKDHGFADFKAVVTEEL